MATSQKGYTAVSRGGRGHKHSALLFIIDLSDENRAQIEFSEHAAHVVSAGFSADDRKLFSIDADGVAYSGDIDPFPAILTPQILVISGLLPIA